MGYKLYLCIVAAVLLNLSKAAKVSETACTKNNDSPCTGFGHAECNDADTDAKCKCSDGYKEKSDDGSTCVLTKVSETACTKNNDSPCTGFGHAECNDADTDAKCKCSDGYKEKSDDGSTCVLKAGGTCTTNKECFSNICEGTDGAKKCAEGNSAQSHVLTAGMISMSLFVTVFQKLF